LKKLIDKTANSETYLSQSFVNDTFALHKKILLVYQRTNKLDQDNKHELIRLIYQTEIKKDSVKSDPLKYAYEIKELLCSYPLSIDLYCELMYNLIKILPEWYPEDKQLHFTLMSIIEDEKTRIINLKSEPLDKKNISHFNPYYKVFNLIPVTKLLPIKEISQILFNASSNTFTEFTKLCKQNNYGLIVIKKHIYHPITYNTTQLLDWKESDKFAEEHKQSYGVDINMLSRFKTIDNVGNNAIKWDFSIETHILKFDNYEKDKNSFVIILDSLAPDQYRINTNFMTLSNKCFIRISSIKELYTYCMSGAMPTRIGQYNKLCIAGATNSMFSPIKADLEKIKEISVIADPKYLRNSIYLSMIEQFKEILNKKYKGGKGIKDNYTYASIIHDDKFLGIFSDVLTHEFHSYLYSTYSEYLTGHIAISEITASFLNVLYIYQRTFVKEIHDYFKDNLFDFNAENITPSQIIAHFDEMVRTVLEKIITVSSNIYQTVLYKINLLKNTLV
jgi:hypothetical protein